MPLTSRGRNDRIIPGPQDQLNIRVSKRIIRAVTLTAKRIKKSKDAVGEVGIALLLGYADPELLLRRDKILATLAELRKSGVLRDTPTGMADSAAAGMASELRRGRAGSHDA